MRIRRAALVLFAWLLLAAAVAVTLVPLGDRPVTSLGAIVERMLAYGAMGAAFTLAYPRRKLAVAALLSLAVAGLEWAQQLAIDRHGRPEDAVEKLVGLLLGLILATVLGAVARRMLRQR